MERALNIEDQKAVMLGVGMEYSFDPLNATGHYRADLEKEDERNVVNQLIGKLIVVPVLLLLPLIRIWC